MNLSCGFILFCFFFLLFLFYPIISHLYSLCHFNSGEVYYRSRITISPSGGILIYQFSLFFLSAIINPFFVYWRGRTDRFRTVPFATTWRIMFLDGFWVLPFTWRTTIGSLILVVIKLIGAIVTSTILLMTFEYFWMEATHTYIFVFVFVGLRVSSWVLVKLSLMVFTADTVKDSHFSTRIEFMWRGWNLELSYFSTHLDFKVL